MTKLYLARHGETFDNERQVMQGQTQGELNDNGIRQAEALSLQLADAHFDAIVASDHAIVARTRLGQFYRALYPRSQGYQTMAR